MSNGGTNADGEQAVAQPSQAAPTGGKKKTTPLVDLIETEKAYVSLLSNIIRRVAAAWSRSNYPPPQLDAIFRSVEAIHKANRALLMKLNEVGPNPSDPRALGDLLIKWSDDLELPYSRYSDGYATGFDEWDPIRSNQNLGPILDELSANMPTSQYASSLPQTWTLDTLFLMPATRLKYYKKLYTKLLKNTKPGGSDHRLLMSASERLLRLIETIESRSSISVGGEDPPPPPRSTSIPTEAAPPPPPPSYDQVSSSPAPASSISPPPRKSSAAPGAQAAKLGQATAPPMPNSRGPSDGSPLPSAPNSSRASPSSQAIPLPGVPSNRGSGGSGQNGPRGSSGSSAGVSSDANRDSSRNSAPTSNTSVSAGSGSGTAGRASTSTMSAPITELERRLNTDRVLDIFTMQPRKCRLQMAPPNLPYSRRVRFSWDVILRFTPRSTGVEVVHRNAHIFLLTDLFLICERMIPEDRAVHEGSDMWLSYPPLSAKHLVAVDLPGNADNILELRVMKKEVLIIQTDSRATKESMLQEFRESWEETMALTAPKMETSASVPGPDGRNFPPNGPGPQERTHTMSPPPSFPPHGGPGPGDTVSLVGLGGPPRAQFGRLAAGSDPNLPLQANQPPNDPGLFVPPPRGASRLSGYGPPPDIAPLQINGDPNRLGPGSGPGSAEGSRGPSPHGFTNLPPLPPSPLPPNGPGGPNGPGPMHHPPSRQGSNPTFQPRRSSLNFDPNTPPSAFPHSPVGGPHGPGSGFGGPPPSSFPDVNGFRGATTPSMRSFDTNSTQSRQQSFIASGSRAPTLNLNFNGPPPPGAEFDSPPSSPDEESKPTGPITSTITAQMTCKVFLKQHHAQWKALGGGKLLLYQQQPTNVKQLVVESDSRSKTLMISTIVLMDAVERVGKTGVAIELSDQGQRTGIVYMIQLKSEKSALGFFETLLSGSDRAAAH